MTTFTFKDIEIESAALGEQTHYPNLNISSDLHSDVQIEGVDEKLYIGYGNVTSILPYKLRDNYDRNKKKVKTKAAILESDGLKAVFLTEYGCRLWSLYDKKEKKELLFCNPVLQFSNFAVRNAWFAGGVEWNIGFIGHNPFTCEKMFCEEVKDSETGAPVFRFYEYERIRGVVYEVDSYISEEHNQLMVRVKIKNPHDKEIPMYWWSNIAVPENLDTRTIVDADEAFALSYDTGLYVSPIPYAKGTDVSYSALQFIAADYFYRVPDDKQKFIASLDVNGEGLIQSSTKRLKGRKLFVWGMNAGGRSWQDFLSKNCYAYNEIQAGLARTQTECIPMPAYAEWEWLESYGYMKANGEKIHSYDWEEAKSEVRNRLISQDYLENELERTKKSIVKVKGKLLQNGSGWGYIEDLRRKKNGESPLFDSITFDKSCIDEETAPWLELLESGNFTPTQTPEKCGFMTQPEYIPMLEKIVGEGKADWFVHFHLGICYHANLEPHKAKEHFEISNSLSKTSYALYCLAHFDKAEGKMREATKKIQKAFLLDSECYPLAKSVLSYLEEFKLFDDIIKFYLNLSDNLKQKGRLKYFLALAYLKTDKIDKFEEILAERFTVDDLKEGETILNDLWLDYKQIKILESGEDFGEDITDYIKKKYPTPKWMNFNMRV